MKCTLSLVMNNAAFEQEPGGELARILRDLANRVEDNPRDMLCNESPFYATDVNGNKVGLLTVTP